MFGWDFDKCISKRKKKMSSDLYTQNGNIIMGQDEMIYINEINRLNRELEQIRMKNEEDKTNEEEIELLKKEHTRLIGEVVTLTQLQIDTATKLGAQIGHNETFRISNVPRTEFDIIWKEMSKRGNLMIEAQEKVKYLEIENVILTDALQDIAHNKINNVTLAKETIQKYRALKIKHAEILKMYEGN